MKNSASQTGKEDRHHSLPTPVHIQSPVIVLVGPTAIGKTELSFAIADQFGCEIISMDSVQVYRHLDIGSAKPTPRELKRVSHHLIDIVNPDEQYNAARFVRDCLQAIEQICAQGKIPLLTGGTGLYLSSLLNGLFETVHVSDEIKKALKKDLDKRGLADLYQELQRIDPVTAQRLHPNDQQRILRGLEIYRATGVPWSTHLHKQQQQPKPAHFTRLYTIGLECERSLLYERINQRTEQMLAQGLIDEVTGLRNMGYGPELSSMQTIGYRHVNQYLDNACDLQTMKHELARDTRRYAKRQMTWFKRQANLNWHERNDKNRIINDIERFLETAG